MTALSNAAKRSIKQAMGNARLGEEICDEIDGANAKTFSGNITIADGKNIILDTTTGTKIGTAVGQKLAFFNSTPVVQQAALTAAHAAITQAGTDSGDVAIQAATNSSPFGFVNAAEFEAAVGSLRNAMARLAEVEAVLEAFGLVAAN
jgi:hypothetical protein